MPVVSASRLQAFLAFVAQMGAVRRASPDFDLRERLQRDAEREIGLSSSCSPSQRLRVLAAIDRACGITDTTGSAR